MAALSLFPQNGVAPVKIVRREEVFTRDRLMKTGDQRVSISNPRIAFTSTG